MFDGSFAPSKGGLGVTIMDETDTIRVAIGMPAQVSDACRAEMLAMLLGVFVVNCLGAASVDIIGDNQFVINVLN
jgi:ribonuclease HI